ncbi:MAG: hypothetical protein N2A99_06530 [Carnobacterium alterfunditum]
MTDKIMPVPSDWIINSTTGIFTLLILAIVIEIFRPSKKEDLYESIINTIKFIVYTLLATYIYLKVSQDITNLPEKESNLVDVLTFFTYALASLEAIHNFYHTLGAAIAYVIRSPFKFFFKKETELLTLRNRWEK